MSNDSWSSPAAVFAGLVLLLNAWMFWQNKMLLKGQEEHEKAAVARNKKLSGEIEEECHEGAGDHSPPPSRRRR